MTDIELVTASLKDKENFRHIVDKYQAPLLRYIKRILYLSINDAEDILQEAFITIYQNLNQYDGKFKLSSWVYRIAHNIAISHIRHNGKHLGISITTEELEKIQNEDTSLDIDLSNSEFVEKLTARLDHKYKEVILLRFFEDKSYTEISDILRISKGTVGSLINRGLSKLKKLLKDEK
ncbi:MAG: RNA polymerase, sigma-24 subunit, ECF subfamily [candidate division WS6 bacterium GW2011_GWF2_39_15]|uniref:RNA polymerase, sigma-24 subunit, ECF subfamily n=1 Tax=candidate division WS6 bacterium GW2011_GWF2_39_15 TaxID=1619100 RepID=A0A0G0Q5X4_9BACT|nr:MAG: RNA polymerase, sigma-24 subunit, ECF subfamily [candidate division WS6 bacterium GW2011_GWF2_39_15]